MPIFARNPKSPQPSNPPVKQKQAFALPQSRHALTDHTQATQSSALRGSGQLLDGPTRALMESRFGHDFGNVRVHADESAAALTHGLNARAAAIGHNLVFGAGEYRPQTSTGKELIAHELAHVVQSRSAPPAGSLKQISQRSDAAEQEAQQAAITVAAGRSVAIHQPTSALVHRAEPQAGAAPKADEFAPDDVPIRAQKPENEKQAQKLRKQVWIMARPLRPEIERNTAQRIREGSVIVRLIDDLPLVQDQEAWMRDHFPAAEVQQRLANGRALIHPTSGPFYLPNDAQAFENPADTGPEIYMRGKAEADPIVTQLIHEVSHKVNRPEAQRFQNPEQELAWQSFVTEARAYYVADYRELEGTMLDYPHWQLGDAGDRYSLADYHQPPEGQVGERRLAVSKLMAVLTYPLVKKYFDADPAFKQACRTWQLGGNLSNAPLGP